MLDETRFVGEIGLDHVTTDMHERREQLRVFQSILDRCACYGDKVLTIHSRRSSSDVLAAIGPAFPGTVILHWFSGPLRDLKRAIDAGIYFSVNPAMIRAASGQKLIAAMPRDRVLTESDGPFVRAGTTPARPVDTAVVLPFLAECWQGSCDDARLQVRNNFRSIIGDF